jgi:hypothetical protein
VPKAGKGVYIEVDTDADIPDSLVAEIWMQGLKVVLNRGMTDVTASKMPEKDKREAEAMAIAQKQLDMLRKGETRVTGGKSKNKASGEVMTEARRIAKALVKDGLRAKKIKISHVDPKVITAAANALLEKDASIIEKAKAVVEERKQITVSDDIIDTIHVSEKHKAKAESEAAKKKQLSAAQAGKTKTRAKGQQLNA